MIYSFLKKNTLTILAFSLIVIINSCAYYSFKGALPSHLKTIAIPLLNNRTPEATIHENLTNKLIDAFLEDNTLGIVDETQANLILTGSVNAVRVQASIVKAGETVSETKLTVQVKIKVEDVVTNKVLIDKNFEDSGLMDATAGFEERNAAIDEALVQLTDKILNATLGGW